jgi:hypothetical protein
MCMMMLQALQRVDASNFAQRADRGMNERCPLRNPIACPSLRTVLARVVAQCAIP